MNSGKGNHRVNQPPLLERLITLLSRSGPLDAEQIAQRVGATRSSVLKLMRENKRTFKKVDERQHSKPSVWKYHNNPLPGQKELDFENAS